jgi:GrpB-like predicted nucleotidyltransferase (UPF0157 family)
MPSSPRHGRPDVTAVDLVGGAEAITVSLQEYDPGWVAEYLEHRSWIVAALSARGASVEVEHIGSTAVPGLAAKPIVDLVVAVDDITAEEDYLEPLLAAGYVLRVREPGHRLVRTRSRNTHVHLYERGAQAIEDYLVLRDRLRASAEDRSLYESTKRALLSRPWSDMNAYAAAKTTVIADIRARAQLASEA